MTCIRSGLRAGLSAALALALAALTAPAAHADDDVARNEARALLQGGNKLLEKGDRAGALALFESAYARFPSPLILINIGTTLRDLDRPAEAANAYARFIAAPGEYTDRLPRIKKLLAELDRGVAQIVVESDPPDAEIAFGDSESYVLISTLPKWRVPYGGATRVRVRKTGYKPTDTTVTPRKGALTVLQVRMEALPPEPVAPPTPTPIAGDDGDDGSTDLGARTSAGSGARFGVTGRALIDGRGRGAAGSAGALVRVHRRVELIGAAIFARPGELTLGAYAGAHVELLDGNWRPRVVAGVPVIFDDGPRVSGRAALGLGWYAMPRFAIVLEVGGEYGFNPAGDIDTWQLTPTLGAEAHL
jgi:hypothetical protein